MAGTTLRGTSPCYTASTVTMYYVSVSLKHCGQYYNFWCSNWTIRFPQQIVSNNFTLRLWYLAVCCVKMLILSIGNSCFHSARYFVISSLFQVLLSIYSQVTLFVELPTHLLCHVILSTPHPPTITLNMSCNRCTALGIPCSVGNNLVSNDSIKFLCHQCLVDGRDEWWVPLPPINPPDTQALE